MTPTKTVPAAELAAAAEPKYASIGVIGLLVILVGVVYGQTLGFGLLYYDDHMFVTGCRPVRAGLTGSSIAWAFTNGPLGEWYPLAMISHMLDCWLFDLDGWGHHLTSVVLHAASAVGLFLVMRRMTGELWPSAAVATIFAVHPQHVESVAWISERRDVLSGLFFVLALGAYAGYVRTPRSRTRYFLVALLLACGLMSKAMLVTVPALLLLLDYWPLGRFGGATDLPQRAALVQRQRFWRLALEKVPLAAIAASDCAITWLSHARWPEWAIPAAPARAANAIISPAVYLMQFFYPLELAPFYPYPEGGYGVAEVAGAAAVLAAISVAAVGRRARRPYAFVGWYWYLGMLVPVLGLVVVAEQARADRYMYLPSIGLSIAVVWGVARAAGAARINRVWLAAGTVVAIGVLVSQAIRQTSYWHDDVALWEHALSVTADNPEAEDALAFALREAGRLDEAAARYVRASRWRTDSTLVNNLALTVAEQGKLDEAQALLENALRIDPGFAMSYFNLGLVHSRQGKLDEAVTNYRRSIELDPNYGPAEINLASILAAQEKRAEALEHCRRGLELAPDSEEGRLLLGRLCDPGAPKSAE